MSDELKTVEKMAEDVKKDFNDKIESLKSSINEKADLEALEIKHAELTEKLDGLVGKEDFTKQQEHLDEISTQLKQLSEYQASKGKSMREQLFEKVKSEDFQEKVKTFSGKGEIAGFELKAADIDTDDIHSGSIETQVEPGVSSAPWRPTPIWDNIVKGVIGQGRDSISWWEETTRTDSAAMVAENAAPGSGSAKTWTKQSMDIKMIKDYTKVSKSALEDFEHITSEVNDLMSNGIPREREAELLSGAGTGTHLKGIDEYYKTFAKPANFDAVTSPNAGDVLAAAILQVMNGDTSDVEKKGYMPNLIFLNPGTRINMQLIKTTIESYIKHPMLSADGNSFNGIKIVTSLDLAAGQFIVGDLSRAKAYVKRNMRISFHYENEDDALKDLVLVLASMRIAGLRIKSHDEYAFVGGSLDSGKELIVAS